MVCIDRVGYQVAGKQVAVTAFDDISGVCKSRFHQSFKDDLFHLLMVVNETNKPIAYCSYWTDIVASPRNFDQHVYFYQIHYVYVRPDYRGQKIASIMAKCFVCHALNELRSEPNVSAFCDKSLYTSDEGIAFGKKIQRLLSDTKRLRFV